MWLTDKPRTIGPEARAPSCASVDVGSTSAANAWTRLRRVIRPRSYWSNNESTMEFISRTSRRNHCRSERLALLGSPHLGVRQRTCAVSGPLRRGCERRIRHVRGGGPRTEFRAVNPSERAWFGHSFGGLFGLYALFHNDGLFQRFVIGS